MLIAGTCRDGQFATVAEELATDHLVITYDRRGTTRSAGPSGWSEATMMGRRRCRRRAFARRPGMAKLMIEAESVRCHPC